MTFPQGYHITWGTYGARLPRSEKPHVTKDQNEYRAPLPEADQWKELDAFQSMEQGVVRLTLDERHCVEDAIIDVAARYEWVIHAIGRRVITCMSSSPRCGLDKIFVTR